MKDPYYLKPWEVVLVLLAFFGIPMLVALVVISMAVGVGR